MNKLKQSKSIIRYVLFQKLKDHPMQPESRQTNDPKYKELVLDIQQNGMKEKPTIDRNGLKIDGHRRIRAAQELGYEGCFCEILDVDDSNGEYFIAYNNNRNISHKDYLGIKIKGGKVSPVLDEKFERIAALYGSKDIWSKCDNRGNGVSKVLRCFERLTNYMTPTKKMTNQKIIDWIMLHPSYSTVLDHIANKIPVAVLKEQITNDKPLESLRALQQEMYAKLKQPVLATN